MATSVQLRKDRATIWERAKEINDGAEARKEEFTAEETETYQKCMDDMDALKGRIDRKEEYEKLSASMALDQTGNGTPLDTRDEKYKVDEKPGDLKAKATPEEMRYLRNGLCYAKSQLPMREGSRTVWTPGTDTRKYAIAFRDFLAVGADRSPIESRSTLQVDLDTAGGFIAASERFISRLIQAVDDLVVVRSVASVFPAVYGETLGAPSLDTDISEFTFGAGELTEAVEDTVAIGKRELRPHNLIPKAVRISNALLQNPVMDVERLVVDRVAVQLANGLEAAYMTGTGAQEPLGLFTASAEGIPTGRDVDTDNTTTAITADHLIEVQGTLKSQYQPNAKWLLNRTVVTLIRKLTAEDAQYIWQPGLTVGAPDVLLGKPILQSEKVPNTMTAALYVGMYADFSWYWIADAVSMTVQRLVEKYALTNEIGLLFNKMAADAMPVQAEAFVRMQLDT